jgi:two-component system sensor histidine kinase GlrK
MLIIMMLITSSCIWGVIVVDKQQREINYQNLVKKQLNVQSKLLLVFAFTKDTAALNIRLSEHFNTTNTKSNTRIDNDLDKLFYQLDFLCLDLLFSESCKQIRLILTNLQSYPIVLESRYIEQQAKMLSNQNDLLVNNIIELLEIHRSNYHKSELLLDHERTKYFVFILIAVAVALLMMLINHWFVSPLQYISGLIQNVENSAKFHSLKQPNKPLPEIYQSVEADIKKLQKKYHKLDDLRNAMLRHAANELKTPLASVNEVCALLGEEVVGRLSPEQREVVMLLSASAKRLNILVERLLDYNTLLQQISPQYEQVNLALVVEECLRDNRLALDQGGIHPIVELTQITAFSDSELIRRMLDNLVSNALAHGTNQNPIYIKIYELKGKVAIEVANNGPALSQESVANLFQPFSRGNTQRNDKVIGAGLGLSIVDECARLLNGNVSLVDVDYADVCFRVVLPLQGVNIE